MQAVFDKSELRQALKTVTNVVDRSATTLPALHYVYVRVDDGGAVQLRASNLDITIARTISGGGEVPGETLLPARQLSAIVEHLPDNVVSFSQEEGASQATVSAGQSWFRLYTMPADEFPASGEMTDANAVACQTDAIKDAVSRVRDAASHDERQQVLSGVLLHLRPSDSRAVATDGRRCAISGITLGEGMEEAPECDAILTDRATRELMRAVPSGRDCTVYIDDTCVRVITENLTFSAKQIEGAYPNYRQIIPESTPCVLGAPRSALLDAVERVALATDEGSTGVTVEVSPDRVDLVAESQIGSAREHVTEMTHNLDESMQLVLNPDFFRDGLRNMPGDYAQIKLHSTSTPVIFEDNEQDDYMYIVMPMREN